MEKIGTTINQAVGKGAECILLTLELVAGLEWRCGQIENSGL
jgi:hypothetical protein